MLFRKKRKEKFTFSNITPDEILLDAENIPEFDRRQLEGRMEKPINTKIFWFLNLIIFLLMTSLLVRGGYLQIVKGESFSARAQDNRLSLLYLRPERGLIYDRNDQVLAWNEPDLRAYKSSNGLAHVVGYIGEFYDKIVGKAGVEMSYDDILGGKDGIKMVEINSKNEVKSESIQQLPEDGKPVHLSIDSRLHNKLYDIFLELSKERGFQAGSGVIMNIFNGEILALVNYPEYNSQVLSSGGPEELIQQYVSDPQKPFLNRAVSGLYIPGSVVKPFVALAALAEGIISPQQQIFGSDKIAVPNPYFPEEESYFYDWKPHGLVDMKRALAVSSNIYFYTIGGGYENITGLGIKKIQEYMKMIGFGQKTGVNLYGEAEGIVPGPTSEWRVGDTYNVSIGQGNFQVTPIQMASAVSFLANNGLIVRPSLVLGGEVLSKKIDISPKHFEIVKEGMRMAVTEGTAQALSYFPVKIAAKTGTAEIGSGKFVNSWLIGFWPYKEPRYAISIVLEKGQASNLIGGVFAARQLFQWMLINTPEYIDF